MKHISIKLLIIILISFTLNSYGQATLNLIPTPTVSGNVYTFDITTTINTANSALTSSEQAKQSAAIANNTANAAKKTADSIVVNWPSGGGFTPNIYNVTANTTIPQLPYGTDIFVNCNNCTLTFNAVQTQGWKYYIHNVGRYTIKFATSLSKVNSLSSIANGQRPIMVTYPTTNSIEIH